MRCHACLVAAVASLVAGAARAQEIGAPPAPGEPIEVSQLELESLLDLEVSAATRQPVKIGDAPANASAMTREQVRDYGWQSINDLLYTLPGFLRSQDYERRLAGFRGESERWNSNRLLLSIDGLPHNNIDTGAAFTWDGSPLFFARKVEVVRGPASAVYGSNAMHGVVAVDTLSAADLGDGGVEARLRAGADMQSLDAVGAQQGSWAEAVVGLSALRSDGDEYMDTDDSYRVADGGGPALFQVQDERTSSYLWTKVEPRAPVVRGLALSLHRQVEQTETNHGWTYLAPDIQEYVRYERTTVDARHQRAVEGVKIESALQLQREDYQAETRHYPAGALDGYYPQGVTEVVDTSLHSLWGRGQAEVGLPVGATALGGVEYTGVLYGGDDRHIANAALVDPTGEYPQLDDFRAQGDLYEPIRGRPVHRIGVYAQAVSGRLLGERVELTVGARYDDLFYRYADLASEEQPVLSDSHQQLSPRAGLVVRPAETLRLKLMAGRAFRTPTVAELFSSNGWTAGSNPKALRPETVTSYEAAVDWAPAPPVRLRANAFYIDHEHIIEYSDDGLLHNILSARRAGAELELLAQTRVGGVALDGFASISAVRLVDETAVDPEIAQADRLVWAPSHLGKAGARAASERFGATATIYYQGVVRRRASDRADDMFNQLRPRSLPAWLTTGATLFYRPHQGIKLGVEASNLFETTGPIINRGAHSFDYRTPPREVLGVVEIDL
jgi:outer membrane receptor protein involved in Fe transport